MLKYLYTQLSVKTHTPACNVQLANQHYLPYIYICTCSGTKQLDTHKECAVTLTGKRPPNESYNGQSWCKIPKPWWCKTPKLATSEEIRTDQITKNGFAKFSTISRSQRWISSGVRWRKYTDKFENLLCALDVHNDARKKALFLYYIMLQMNKRE